MRHPLRPIHLGLLGLVFCVASSNLPPITPVLPPPPPPSQIIVSALETMEFNPYRLYTYQLDGTHTEFPHTRSGGYEYSPAPDAAGDVVFAGGEGNQSEIYLWPAAGGSLVRLTNNSVPDLDPALSPDGTKLVFCRPAPSRSDGTCLWVAGFFQGGLVNIRQLTYDQTAEPSFSPDGTKIVYAEQWVPPGTNRVIHRLRVYDLAASRVTSLLGSVCSNYDQRKPSWSPDGSRIAFALERSAGIYDLALVDSSGGSPAFCTSTQLYDEGGSSWAPSGRGLVVESIERASLLRSSQTWVLEHLTFSSTWAVTSTARVAEMPGLKDHNPHPAWTAAPRPQILEDILSRGKVGTIYSYVLRAAGGVGAYQWQLKATSALPAGLSLDAAGCVSGTPTQPTPSLTPCRFTAVVRDRSGAGAAVEKLLSLEILPANSLTLDLGAALPIAVTGRAYHLPLPINGGQPPYTVSAKFYPSGLYGTEVVIPGLALWLDSSTGQWRLSGLPQETFPAGSPLAGQSVAGAYLVTFRVADSRGASVLRVAPNFVSLRVLGNILAPPFYSFGGEDVWSAPSAMSGHQYPRRGVAIAGSVGVNPDFALRLPGASFPLTAVRRGGGDIYWFDLGGVPDWPTLARAEGIAGDEQQVIIGELSVRIRQAPYADLELGGQLRVYRYTFRHARGPQCENFTSRYTWDDFERFFGPDECEYAGLGIDTGVASLIFDVFVGPEDGIGKGTCFGLCLFGEKLWNGDPALYGSPLPGTTAWTYGQGTEAGRQHLWQLDLGYLEEWIHFFLDHYDELGKATVEEIGTTLAGKGSGSIPEWPYLLAIAEGFGSAHTVVPYAYEELPDGWCRIRVYDPNRPFRVDEENDGGSYITINPNTSDWRFDVGGGTVFENAYLIPVRSDVCRGDPELISDLIEAGGVVGELLDDGWDFLWYILAGAVAPEQVSDPAGRTLLAAEGKPNLNGLTRIPDAGMIPLSGGSSPAGLFFAPKGDELTFSLRAGGEAQGGGHGEQGYEFVFGTAGKAVIRLEVTGEGAGAGDGGGGADGGLDTVRCNAQTGTLEYAPGAPRRCALSILTRGQADEAGGGGVQSGRALKLGDLVLQPGDQLLLAFDGQRLALRLLQGAGPLACVLSEETASGRGREGFNYGRFSLPAGQEWRFVPGYQPGEPPAPFKLEIDLGADGTVDETRNLAGTPAPLGPQHGGVILGFRVGSKIMTVNTVEQAIDVAPMSVLGRTMLPVRYVTDPLGARIGWSQAEGKTTITLGETIIELWIGKNKARVDGREVPVDSSNAKVVPLIVGGRTMLPMRFVAENLGCTVEWNAGAVTVVGP